MLDENTYICPLIRSNFVNKNLILNLKLSLNFKNMKKKIKKKNN